MKLKSYTPKNNQVLLAIGVVVYMSVTGYLYTIFGETAVMFSVVLLLLGLFVFLTEIYWRTHDKFEQQWQSYYQIESLFFIFSQIKFRTLLSRMRRWAASPDFLAVMVSEILDSKPKFIVDLGSGVSTIIAGYLMEDEGGMVLGIDHDKNYAKKTSIQLKKHGLSQNAKVIYSPLQTQIFNGTTKTMWYDIDKLEIGERKIDMLIVDGPPEMIQSMSRYPAVPVLHKYLSDNATILIDDSYGKDMKKAVQMWLEEYPDFVEDVISAEKGMTILRRIS